MAQVVNTNVLSLITQNNLNRSQGALGTAIERLSSGARINSAKDDAAGQAIANRFTANIRGLTQASRNANDSISLEQVTEGAVNEINDNLQRIRELSVQAANGSNSKSDITSINEEVEQRLQEIDRISQQTQFNGIKVLAKDGKMKFQVGANDGEVIEMDMSRIDRETLGMNGFKAGTKIALWQGADKVVGDFKNSKNEVGTDFVFSEPDGATWKPNVAQTIKEAKDEKGNVIKDTYIVTGTVVENGVDRQASFEAHIKVDDKVGGKVNVQVTVGDEVESLVVGTKSSSANQLSTLDKALSKVDTVRSKLGAIQNRMQSTINNLNNSVNNLSAARSRIQDADFAVEVSNMSRGQILQQAGTAVLAQANQIPQNALSLLR